MKKNIITISREFGSGGGMIGKMVAEQLGIPCYDREMIDSVAKETGFDPTYIEDTEQQVTNSLLYNIALGASYGYGIIANNPNQIYSLSEQVYLAQKKAIQKFADQAPCVIVGRCADYALRGREDVLNIFIYADIEERIKRVAHEHGLDISVAKAEVQKSDKSRANHYRTFTHGEWGKRGNYNLMLDSSLLGIEGSSKLICDLVRRLD